MGQCCSSFFKNTDKVLKKADEALDLLSRIAMIATAYMQLLQASGVDTQKAIEILEHLQHIADASGEVIDALKEIQIPESLDKIGDINGDGQFDQEDVLMYMTNAQKVCDALIAAGVKTEQVQEYREELQKIIDIVRQVPVPKAPENSATVATSL